MLSSLLEYTISTLGVLLMSKLTTKVSRALAVSGLLIGALTLGIYLGGYMVNIQVRTWPNDAVAASLSEMSRVMLRHDCYATNADDAYDPDGTSYLTASQIKMLCENTFRYAGTEALSDVVVSKFLCETPKNLITYSISVFRQPDENGKQIFCEFHVSDMEK